MFHSINVTMIFVGFAASQQELNRIRVPIFMLKRESEQESNFPE